MTVLSERLCRLNPSATRAMSERAAELRTQGRDVISLSTGEPDFVSPDAAMEAARTALDKGQTFYSPTAGIPELRAAIRDDYARRFNLSYDTAQIMVGAGAKPLLFQAFAALVNPGDEVILNAPAWVSYVEQIRFFDGKAVILETDPQTLDLDLAAIRAALTPHTRAIVLNSPNNPSGRLYPDEEIKALCALAVEHDLIIINDEVYERILFDGAHYRNPVELYPAARGHVLNINAVSKSYAMTGWRIGFALGPQEIIKRMTRLQGHLTSGASSIAQWAATGALRDGDDAVHTMSAHYQNRKDLMAGLLDHMPDLRYVPPQGAFYIFADIRATFGKYRGNTHITDDISFCEALLEQDALALVPGTAFLQPGFVRLSLATSPDIIRAAMKRLNHFLTHLTPDREST